MFACYPGESVNKTIYQREPLMEDKKSYLQLQADEIQKWGIKIDELKAKVDETKSETRSKLCEQIDELRMRTESACDNLIKVFYLIKNQKHSG
jgi:hypothetical protein